MEKITATVRVTDLNVRPFDYEVEGKVEVGESVVIKAFGHWKSDTANPEVCDQFPVSLHMTAYPGHGIVPALGDNLSIAVERSN
jgi:hypothetical protein